MQKRHTPDASRRLRRSAQDGWASRAGFYGLPGSIPQRSMASLHEDLQRSDAMDTRPTATVRPIQYGINASRPLPDAPRRIVGLLMYSSSRRARQQTHSGPRLFGNATNFTILHEGSLLLFSMDTHNRRMICAHENTS